MFNDSTPGVPACQAPHHMGGHRDTSRLNVEEMMVTWGYDEAIAWEYVYNMTYNMTYNMVVVRFNMAMVMDKSWV